MDTESILDSNLAIVKDNPFGNSAEIEECLNQSIQKALLFLLTVGQHYGSAVVTKPCAEQVDYSFDSAEINSSLALVNLHGISCWKDKRNEAFLGLFPGFSRQPSDGCLAAGEAVFDLQTVVDALGSDALTFILAFTICVI